MFRGIPVFRVETLSRRTITLLFLAFFTASFLMTPNDAGNSRRRTLFPMSWFWQDFVSYQYVHSFRNVAIASNFNQYEFAWYQQLVGQFHYHKQQLGIRGIRIADWYRTEITIASDEQISPIILAAAIANQSNSPTRPFDINLIEQFQLWLGESFDWPIRLGRDTWNDKFESPSIGIAQIMPIECKGHSPWALFDNKSSIGFMFDKLQHTSQAALNLRINHNDWFALTLIGNNIGEASVSTYREYLRKYSFAPKSMKQFLNSVPANKKQLARMLGYVEFLSTHEGWSLPKNVDMEYLWSLVE